MIQFSTVVLMAGLFTVAGCTATAPVSTAVHGVVESVTQVDRDASRIGNTPGMSGVPGTLQGHPATGRLSQPASASGSSGGALTGQRLASRSGDRNAYEVRVRLDDGTRRTFTQEASAFAAGDRVRVTADGRLLAP